MIDIRIYRADLLNLKTIFGISALSPIIEPMEQTVPENSAATIRCSVPGHPNARLVWRRENGVEVSTAEGVKDDGKGTLSIARAGKGHARMGWVCWAIYPERADKKVGERKRDSEGKERKEREKRGRKREGKRK